MRSALSIGGFEIALSFRGSADAARRWSPHAAPYATPTERRTTGALRLELDIELLPGWRNPHPRDAMEIEYAGQSLRAVAIEKPVMSGRIFKEQDGYRGDFRVAGDDPDFIDYAVAACLSFACEEAGQLLLHASAVERDGRAWLFLGPGGSGKTTIALELHGGGVPMSVDKTLVRFGEDGELRAFSTPFGDGASEIPGARSAPVAGLVLIEQAAGHALEKPGAFAATAALLRQTFSASRDRASVSAALEIIGRMAEMGIVYRLRFEKDDRFWPLLLRGGTL
jgi:hypothetical protein